MKTYVILCADNENSQIRWNNYLGVSHKQFMVIDNERLIDRTVRLLNLYNPESKIYIVARSDDFKVNGSELIILDKATKQSTCERTYIEVRDLWFNSDETIFMYGDVWYSDECVKTISNYFGNNIHFFGRKSPSSITGKPYQEQFALYINKPNYDKLINSIYKLEKMYQEKKIWRIAVWQLYDLLHNNPPINHQAPSIINKGDWTEINDFTEDFDNPKDYDMWIERYRGINN